jgi:hypothetical protein
MEEKELNDWWNSLEEDQRCYIYIVERAQILDFLIYNNKNDWWDNMDLFRKSQIMEEYK